MDTAYAALRTLHVLAFVFMSVPLFNLIAVNERAQLGSAFNYEADRYLENIIRRGATRCFAFQATVLLTGMAMLVVGPLGIGALWGNWVLLVKTLALVALMGLLSYVHLGLQPRIEALLAQVGPNAPVPEGFVARLKPFRVLRKRLATLCLFLVLLTIILGMQVYGSYDAVLTVVLITLAGLFAWRANRTLVRFGWL
jgi:hypothetical protein